MKVVKPMKLGALTRVFELKQQAYFVASIFVFFALDDADSLLPDINLWKLMPKELGPDGILDEGMGKPCGEVLVDGSGFAPGGKARGVFPVRARLGSVDKTIYVIGPRVWKQGAPTEPTPIKEMRIEWARAFGGPSFPNNPVGIGAAPEKDEEGREVHRLPNLELPDKLLHSPKDKPPPACFSSMDPMWPVRFSKVGTYDDDWMREGFPGLALDLDPAYFNTAPEDQRIEGFFAGGESFRIENMHPERPVIEGRLPSLVARCFVNMKTAEGEKFEEIPMRADTVRLWPRSMRGIMTFRGVIKVAEDDGADVLQLIVAGERKGQTRPVSHYVDVLKKRLDPDRGHLHVLRDGDLLPEPLPDGKRPKEEAYSDMSDLLASEDLMRKRAMNRLNLELVELREKVAKQGLNPDEHLPKKLPEPEPTPSIDELPAYLEAAMGEIEKIKANAALAVEKAEAEMRAKAEELGCDYDELVAKAKKEGGGLPKFTAKGEFARLKGGLEEARAAGSPHPDLEAQLDDPAFYKKLEKMEQAQRQMYRAFVHRMPAASIESDTSERLRMLLLMRRDNGEPLSGFDWTGANLAGLDLRGVDFTESFLEGADLRGADLSGAQLTRAVFCRAKLDGAILDNANLTEANLGQASLKDAKARGANLEKAQLFQTVLVGCDLEGAKLDGADFMECQLDFAKLSRASLAGTMIFRARLSNVDFGEANLTKTMLIECDAKESDFSKANATSLLLVGTNASGSKFRGTVCVNLRVVADSSLDGADFEGADLTGANFRKTPMLNANLRRIKAPTADFSECDLRGADLSDAMIREGRFIRTNLEGAKLERTNLMFALVQKANVSGASLKDANLFRADFARVRGDDNTNLAGANMKEVRVVKGGHAAR